MFDDEGGSQMTCDIHFLIFHYHFYEEASFQSLVVPLTDMRSCVLRENLIVITGIEKWANENACCDFFIFFIFKIKRYEQRRRWI